MDKYSLTLGKGTRYAWAKRAPAWGAVAEYFGEKFYAIKFDAETKTQVTFNGQTYDYTSEAGRNANALAFALGKVSGKLNYPTIVFLDENLKVLDASPGYKDAAAILKLAKFYGENRYNQVNFQQFMMGGQ